MFRCLVVLFCFVVAFNAKASIIYSDSFLTEETNPVYWTQLDFGLDIMRLSWSDTLTGGQASVADINQFIADNTEGWRWASFDEFNVIHNWFDTDPYADGWSALQNDGSALFFLLNGTGPAFTEQHGYDHEGYTYWQFGTLVEQAMYYVWMAEFANAVPGVSCADYSLLCQSGYFTDSNSPMWLAPDALFNPGLNIAPLLVRNTVTPQPATVPEPQSLLLFATGVLGIMSLRRRRQQSI